MLPLSCIELVACCFILDCRSITKGRAPAPKSSEGGACVHTCVCSCTHECTWVRMVVVIIPEHFADNCPGRSFTATRRNSVGLRHDRPDNQEKSQLRYGLQPVYVHCLVLTSVFSLLTPLRMWLRFFFAQLIRRFLRNELAGFVKFVDVKVRAASPTPRSQYLDVSGSYQIFL